jgi:hypothetical protein
MRLASNRNNYLVIPLLLMALYSNGQTAKIPKGNLDVLIRQNSEYGQNLVSRIAINIERELRGRGYANSMNTFFTDGEASASEAKFISITIYKSQWKTDKAFSIPFVLNRMKRVYEIEVFLEFIARDGKKIAERMNFSQDTGVQAQVMTNDPYDPDLFPDQSSRLMIEDIVIRKLAREIADKLGSKLS